jgi:hypothetical protein
MYYVFVIFPIESMVLPTGPCSLPYPIHYLLLVSLWSLWSSLSNTLFIYGLPYDPYGPPSSIDYLSLVFPIQCMVLPTDPCSLPYPINYLVMVFPVTLVVLPVQLLLISGLPYSMHGPSHWSLRSSLSNLHIVLVSMT